ncbi:hypothetical protein ACFW0B_25370, partial [Pseudomonas sp. CR1201]
MKRAHRGKRDKTASELKVVWEPSQVAEGAVGKVSLALSVVLAGSISALDANVANAAETVLQLCSQSESSGHRVKADGSTSEIVCKENSAAAALYFNLENGNYDAMLGIWRSGDVSVYAKKGVKVRSESENVEIRSAKDTLISSKQQTILRGGGVQVSDQKISGVAPGTVSKTSTDAINGSQLNATNENVTAASNLANTANNVAQTATVTANAAQKDATNAVADASKALSAANVAKEDANKAVTAANEAKADASNAVSVANGAKDDANKAVTASNEAKVDAGKALVAAAEAKTQAAGAQADASNAVSVANSAKDDANKAVTASSEAKVDAGKALVAAAEAKTQAAGAQADASNA